MELRTACRNRWLIAQQFPSRAGRKPHLHPPSAVNYYGSICGSSPKPLAHAVGQQCNARGTLGSASASVSCSCSATAQVELSKSTAGRGTHWPHTLTHTHAHRAKLAGPLWPQASVAHSRCIDATSAKNLPPYGNLRVAWRRAAVVGDAQGRRAMIKSNTERIRSDVTQAVRAESTPCGMQSRQQKNYPCRRKSFCFPQSPSLIPTPTLSASPQAMLSWVDRHTIYISQRVLCVCVCVLAGNVQPNPMAVWSGLGWSRQLSQLQKSWAATRWQRYRIIPSI